MKKKATKVFFLSLALFSLMACGSNSKSNKGCGETCRIGDKRHIPVETIPTEEAVFPE